MTDEEIIKQSGIQTAVIVDDGYDLEPTPDEVADADWDIFLDDAVGDRAENIRGHYPDFDPSKREALRQSDDFVSTLWKSRHDLKQEIGELFDVYDRKDRANRKFLDNVEATLTDLGIKFQSCGRDFVETAVEADLIVVDLFLGTSQKEIDRQLTVTGLRKVMERKDVPPTVILMSQLSIDKKAPELRDEVELHASGFQGIRKQDVDKAARLRRIIVSLASHRSDSQLLATFTQSWTASAKDAVKRSAKELRRIDIDDLHHIRSMVLCSEGLHPSSYLIDVLDRILQYEIEADANVLKAATAINQVGKKPAPLLIAQEKDSYRLIERLIYQNPERRSQKTGAAWPITFGDVIVSKNEVKVSKSSVFKGDVDRAFFVASPECDFVRDNKLTSALLIAGNLVPLKMGNQLLADRETTAILDLGKRGRFQINWDFGMLETITLQRARNLLAETGPGQIAGTMRDISALNLRQQFLDHFGRVGLMVPPPRNFRVSVDCQIPLHSGGHRKLVVGAKDRLDGTMLIDRTGVQAHIVLDQSQEADLAKALLDLDLKLVAKNSRAMIEKLREQSYLRQICRTGFRRLKYPLVKMQKGRLQQPDDAENPNMPIVATIINDDDGNGLNDPGDCQSFGLMVRVAPIET